MNIEQACEIGPTAYCPYRRRLKVEPFADIVTKAALSPSLFKDIPLAQ